MPSGPKKRHAARRRSMGRTGTRDPLDNAAGEKTSGSELHVSDEGTGPVAAERRSSRLSLPAGTSEAPADQTFQTEEWVRVSDFDVGTPSSTAAKSDFDGHDGVGDARGHDKLADWETVSRENARNFSSAEEVGEGERRGVGDSVSGRKQGQALAPCRDGVLSGSDSEKEEDGKSSRSGSSSLSSGSDAKKSSDEERSSGIVVVPPYRDDSRESSYAEVASVDAREDECHRSVANVSSPEGKEGEYQASSAIEPASSEEQEDDSYELFSGVDDHASSAIEPASSDEQEEEKYTLFSDLSNVKDMEETHSGSDGVDLSSLLRPQSGVKSFSDVGHPKTEHNQAPKVTERKPEPFEMNKSRPEVISSAASEPSAQGDPEIQMDQGGSAAEESTRDIEPTTPQKTSEKSSVESPYAFVWAVSDGDMLEPVKASPPEAQQAASETHGDEEYVAKEAHDTSFGSGGLSEPSQEELKQLLEIAHSKEIAVLGKQEEKILAHEEQELGKGIVEPHPIVDVLSATDPFKPLEGGELEDLQPVGAEEAPLLKVSSSPIHSDLVKDRVPVLFTDKSGEKSLEESQSGVGDEHQTAEALLTDDSAPADLSAQTKLLPAESTKDVEATFEAENGDRIERISGSSEKLEQVGHQGKEDQPRILRPIQTSSDTWGCCEPVQWLFANFRRWVNPPAIRN